MKRIAIIEGGISKEEIISRKSAKTILDNIDKTKYIPVKVSIDSCGWFAHIDNNKYSINKSDFSYVHKETKVTFDFAFIMIHGTPGEDGKLQGFLDLLNIPYNTPSQLISSLTFNKFFCNKLLKSFGINVANSKLIRKHEPYKKEEIIKELGLPCFVKPSEGGSSFGITKVEDIKQLDKAIERGLLHSSQVIIESFLEGREVTNGIFFSKKGYKTLAITEVITNNTFFDFDAKYKGESKEITPAPISEKLTNKVKNTTKKVAEILNIKGVSRIDYIIVEETPYLIEVNTIPGMSQNSLIPQMLTLENIKLSEFISEIIETCS